MMSAINVYDPTNPGCDDKVLESVVCKEPLQLHYDNHHTAYVNGAISMLQRIAGADNVYFDTMATFNELSFHIGSVHSNNQKQTSDLKLL